MTYEEEGPGMEPEWEEASGNWGREERTKGLQAGKGRPRIFRLS